MLAQVHFPPSLFPDELDRYLADGWFRMGQSIFTTNFLNFKQEFYSAIWLRVALAQCGTSKRERHLFKLNSKFTIEIQPAKLKPEQESLFARYRQEVSFEPSSSLHLLLFGKGSTTIYNTLEINIYDEKKLIACGFFDLGTHSAAGITSFYDPGYRKYSLGKFLIFLKIDYCRKLGLKYFYPGYFVPGYSAFDYKLTIHREAIEFLELKSQRWKPLSDFSVDHVPLLQIDQQLTKLQEMLNRENIESKVLSYDYFDANLVPDLNHLELFDFPRFLHFYDMQGTIVNSLVVFDVRDQRFHWMVMKSVWMADQVSTDPNHYTAHLLKVEEEVIAMDKVDDMCFALLTAIRAEVLKQQLG